MSERPKISVDGVDFEWDRENGLLQIWGQPVVCMWIETTMAGLMSGLIKMVGPERFAIATEQAGRDSIEGEWEHIITPQPTIEDGLTFIGKATGTVGLGMWELVSLDREKKEARFRSRNDWESLYQRALGIDSGAHTLCGKFGGYATKIFGTYCRAEQVAHSNRGAPWDEFVARPAEQTLEAELDALLGTENATRADLTAALERLRAEVEERKRMEDELRREVEERARVEEELRSKLAVIREQKEAIRSMSTPILQVWDSILTMPVIGIVDSDRASHMMASLLEEITQKQARFTILDLTGVNMLDSDAAGHVLSLVSAASLLGTRCLVSGISPAMASTIVGLGLDLGELVSFGSLEAALRYAIKENRNEGRELAAKKKPRAG